MTYMTAVEVNSGLFYGEGLQPACRTNASEAFEVDGGAPEAYRRAHMRKRGVYEGRRGASVAVGPYSASIVEPYCVITVI